MNALDHPLKGILALVTRPAGDASRLSVALEAEGASVIELPSIQIEPPFDWVPLDQAIARGRYDWVVFASANAVQHFVSRIPGQAAQWFLGTRVAAIGSATARDLESAGVRPNVVPDEFVAEALVAIMADAAPLTGQRVLLPPADIGRQNLADGLTAAGAEVHRVVAYRIVTPAVPAEVLDRLRQRHIDLATFTSAATVRNLVAMLGDDVTTLNDATIACIGPITAESAAEMGLRPSIVAATYTIPGLVEAIKEYYSARVMTTSGGN